MSLQSGFKTVTPIQFANSLHALTTHQISYKTFRIYFGCFVLLAAREAAKRTAKRKGRKPADACRYRVTELCSLTGLREQVVRKELRRLVRTGLISFSETVIKVNSEPVNGAAPVAQILSGKRSPKRPIPVLRSVLRLLARTPRSVLGKTLIAYIVRGLTIDRDTAAVRGVGTVKVSWISKTFALSLRSVKSARRELIESGFISKDTASFQRKLNRDGAYFRINLDWSDKRERSEGGTPLKSAPLQAAARPKFAPPYKDKKTSYESKNQKTESRTLKLTGVCKANQEGEPTLRDVKPEDLKRFSRLRALFGQAVEAGWIQNSEANFLNWLAAAVRAQTVEARSPVRVFLGIVRKGRWEFITLAQEDRARAAIMRNREKENHNFKSVEVTYSALFPKHEAGNANAFF